MDTVIETGQPAPEFQLPDLRSNLHALEDARGRILVLNFWSAECPWAERADEELLAYLDEWGGEVLLWPIASNANEPEELLRETAGRRGLPLVLHDPDHRVADLYGAQTTPHLFVIDGEGILRYQGALNDLSFRKRIPEQFYLRDAVQAVLAGETPDPAQTPPYGCSLVRYNPGA